MKSRLSALSSSIAPPAPAEPAVSVESPVSATLTSAHGLLGPLFQLLRYVPPHRKYAALTLIFGSAGFLLSFAYPWIIGSVVEKKIRGN